MNRKVMILLIIFIGVFLIKSAYATVYVTVNHPESKSSTLGDFVEERKIEIELQDYIDAYLNWTFIEINNTHWYANFTFNTTVYSDMKSCYQKRCTDKCWTTLQTKYFLDYDKDKLCNDIKNLTNYPYQNLTEGIKIQKLSIDVNNGIGSFYIIFPEGFKVGEKAKFGFNSTIINTATTAPFYPNQRAICRDSSNYIHVVWLYNSTTIKYAKSTDNGQSWQITSWYNETANTLRYPHISCDGSNITIVYANNSMVMKLSTNNGATWTTKLPRTSGVDVPLVERRGQRIYVVYKNLDTYADINFFNSSDAGSTWSSDVVLFNGQYVGRPIYMSDNYYEPSLAVNGTGSSADNLFVAVRLITTDHVYGESYYYIKFKNSSSSGASWSSSAVTVANSGVNEASYPSITYLNGNLYIAYTNASIGKQVWLANSSGSYTTWNNTMLNPSTEGASQLYTYRLKLDKGTVTIFENQPAVIYPQNNGWWNIVKTIKSGDATAKAYYAQNSAGADPGSATTEFTDTYYNQANTSNSVYYQLTTTSNSGYTRYFFNFSGISGTDGLSNYTIYFKGYATGDTANLMYKSSSNWYNFQSLTSSDSTYTFSNTSTSSLTPYYYVVEFGTKQTNTSVGTDNTYVDSINITGAMRKMPDLALRNFTSSGLSNIQWIASEGSSLNSSILDVNAKYDYSGNCLEFVYRNGTASPYNIVYDSIGSCTSPVKQYNQTGSLSLTLLENGLKQAIFSRTKDLSFLLLEDSLKSYIANRLTSLFIILSTKVYVPVEIPPFICSMFRQIGDSNAYLCIFDNGTWKILIKLQIGNSYFYVFVDEPWEILIKGACILNALGNCY